ncbi:cytochrome c biogenesis protein CcsA [Aliiglaciecola sp. LCG003]|uniref:cytochrome C assembly family protein n=1 Tax=Aliiglaciecola sp. LCG003 TaxID=3053655 RepID=UPI002572EA0B|nr:cytochrome c biogenesis protein CcsA [Aliiglaciecola sp. LCG003]WJG10639.1 cytochrome c biogenesis protein CcsA [Aliiglaciecola sp. LCG003]
MLIEIVCIVFYLCAAGWVGSRLFHHQGPNPTLMAIPAFLALTAHLYLLWEGILQTPGQNMSMLNVASLLAWLITFTMTLASFTFATAILMPVVFSFSAIIVLLSVLIPDIHIMQIELHPGLLIHISLALLAYGCLLIAVLYALQLSYISGRLKDKRPPFLHSSLPPLMTVETIFFKLLLTGTILLTLSLASGFVFLDNMLAKEQAHKTILSILAWLVFVVTTLGHQRWGWRGKRVISATLIGALLLTIAYFGSRFVREVLLN